ncbi:MAG TPA: hypothetical protein VFZ34_28415 [Blastocatellia bacterium]|nr:hypothetical protein [Blastocatellia bacterium]
MREKVYCPDCNVPMEFHPVTSANLRQAADALGGILDEFYSCPACGKTAVPNETMFAQQPMHAYAWHQVVAMKLF